MPKRDSVEIKEIVVTGTSKKQLSFVLQSPIFYLLHIYNRLTRPIFSPIDRAVIDQLLNHVDGGVCEIIKSQLSEINDARPIHYSTKSETWFYKIRPLWISLSRKKSLALGHETVILATLRFRCKAKTYNVDFVCVESIFSALEYNKSTEAIENIDEIEVLGFDLDAQPIDDFGHALS